MCLAGLSRQVLAVCNGGAEVPILSYKVYQEMDPQPVLRRTTEVIRGLYGPHHQPVGECTL